MPDPYSYYLQCEIPRDPYWKVRDAGVGGERAKLPVLTTEHTRHKLAHKARIKLQAMIQGQGAVVVRIHGHTPVSRVSALSLTPLGLRSRLGSREVTRASTTLQYFKTRERDHLRNPLTPLPLALHPPPLAIASLVHSRPSPRPTCTSISSGWQHKIPCPNNHACKTARASLRTHGSAGSTVEPVWVLPAWPPAAAAAAAASHTAVGEREDENVRGACGIELLEDVRHLLLGDHH